MRVSTVVFVFGVLLLSNNAESQVTHNLLSFGNEEITDARRIATSLNFLVDGIRRHDASICTVFFDTLVSYQGAFITRDSIARYMTASFRSCELDTNQLQSEYSARSGMGGPVLIIRNVNETPSANGTCQVDSAYNIELQIRTALDEDWIDAHLKLRRRSISIKYPSVDFVCFEIDNSFYQAISQYYHNYSVWQLGTHAEAFYSNCNGSSEGYDYYEMKPKGCDVTVADFTVTQESVFRVPFDFQIGGEQYSQVRFSQELCNSFFGKNVCRTASDFRVIDNGVIGKQLMVLDRTWGRVARFDIPNLSYSTLPFLTSDYQFLQSRFGDPLAFDVNASGEMALVDLDSSVLHCFVVDNSCISGFRHTWSLPFGQSTPARGIRGIKLSPLAIRQSAGNVYSYYYSDSSQVWYTYWVDSLRQWFLTPYQRTVNSVDVTVDYGFSGYYDNCSNAYNQFRRVQSVFVNQYNLNGQNGLLFRQYPLGVYGFGNRVVFADQNIVRMDATMPTTCFNTGKIITFLSNVDIRAVSKNFDGTVYMLDKKSNLIHVFESYDMEYLCSYDLAALGDTIIYSNLQLTPCVYSTSSYSGCYDIYISNGWLNGGGIQRLLPLSDIVNARRSDILLSNGSLSTLRMTMTARTSYDVLVGDSSVSLNNVTDARKLMLQLVDVADKVVAIRYRPSGVSMYRQYSMLDKIIYLLPDGSIVRKTEDNPIHKTDDISIYPTICNGIIKFNISHSSTQVDIQMYNALGRQVAHTSNIGVVNFGEFPAGVYYVFLRGKKLSVVKKIVNK